MCVMSVCASTPVTATLSSVCVTARCFSSNRVFARGAELDGVQPDIVFTGNYKTISYVLILQNNCCIGY